MIREGVIEGGLVGLRGPPKSQATFGRSFSAVAKRQGPPGRSEQHSLRPPPGSGLVWGERCF